MAESLIACEGGLDLRSAAISAAKGTLSVCYNYEKDQGPGYVKRLGWCRYDGRIQGPENDAALVIFFNAGQLVGSFQYGEQVRISGTGYATLTGICIGFNFLSISGLTPFLVVAYPVTTFTNAVDVTGFPINTSVLGLNSGATIATIVSAKLMNDSTLSILQYDAIKGFIQYQHAGAVKIVPGRIESPVDAIFTYNGNTYAVHDCIIFTFTAGQSSVLPLEGHVIRDAVTGFTVGKILSIPNTSGDWTSGSLTGSFVVYDFPVGQALPSAGNNLNLYDATNTTLLVSGFCKFGTAAAAQVNPLQTRALLYSTYEQFVKNQTMSVNGANSIVFPPTWARVPMNRELPFTCKGAAATLGFGPSGSNAYSIYEYSRQGLTAAQNALTPISTGEQACTVASESNPSPHWVNVNNIKVQDAATANYVTIANGAVSDFLQATAFNGLAAIPPGSIILGITVRLRWTSSTLGAAYQDETVSLMGNNFPNGRSATNKASHQTVPPTSLTDYTYGSATDTWGEQLTLAQIQDPSFGVCFRFQRVTTGGVSPIVQVDYVALTVTYAPPTRTVYIRDPSATTVTDVVCNVIDYQVDSGDFLTSTAQGVLTIVFPTEAGGTQAGKNRRIGKGNEIRDAASSGANVANGNLLAYVAGEDYPITFPASGALDQIVSRYECQDANFWDTTNARAMFIVNGVEYAVQFDGTYFVRIHTGRSPSDDCPRHVTQHGSPTPFLYLGFKSGGLSWTGAGHPTHYLDIPSSGTLPFGEPITGLLSVNGQTLGIWTDRATRGLQGNDPSGTLSGSASTPIMISPAINCIEYTLVNLVGEAVWTSYRGVETLRTVLAYGDFETLPLSAAAQLWLQPRIQVDSRIGSRPSRALYAVGIRNKRQYRLFFEDGYYFSLTMFDAGDSPVCMTGRIIRPQSQSSEGNVALPYNNEPWNSGVIRHVYNGTRQDGKELIFATFENQNVNVVPPNDGTFANIGPYFPYGVRLDCGFNDDVLPSMPCYIEFNSFYGGFPNQVQQWQTCDLVVQAYGGTVFQIYTKTDFDGPIFDLANNSQLTVTQAPIGVYQQTLTLPLGQSETRAFIPIPYRMVRFSVGAEGLSLKLRIDGTQVSGITATVVPQRITHINVTTGAEALPEG